MTMAHGPADRLPGLIQLIRASAGSGKTYALSSHFIRLMRLGAPPRSILATTFTRKAAGEILGRVLLRLAKAANDPKQSAELAQSIRDPRFTCDDARKLLGAVCQELHRVNVSTLDAFFSRMASSFRLELDLPLEPAMVSPEDPQAARARQDAIESLLAGADPAIMVDLLRRTHHDHVARSVTRAIQQIITTLYEQYRLTPQEEVWSRLDPPDELEPAALAAACQQLESMLGPGLSVSMGKAIRLNLDSASRHDWKAFFEKGLAPRIFEGQTTYSRQEIPEAVVQVYRPLLDHGLAVLLGQVARQTRATWELLRDYDAHFTGIRRKRNLVMFSDLPLKLANDLSETSDIGAPGLDAIYYRIDGQVTHLLLDEFQDTSPMQWQVLEPLARDVVFDAEMARSFFCVGDVKQSIYNWRGGCAELFDKLIADLSLPGDAIESQDASYRTSQVVLDVVNHVFEDITACGPVQGKGDKGPIVEVTCQWADAFRSHTARRDRPGHVALRTSPAPDDSPDDYDSESDDAGDDALQAGNVSPHAEHVAQYVKELADQHPTRTVGVLVKTNKMVNQLIHQMKKLGLPASGEGGNPVTDDPAVELILSALLLADHPGDRVVRHHVAQSPLAAALPLADLSTPALERFSQRTRHQLMAHGYAAVIERWAGALAPFGDARNATRLSQLVELAEAYQPQATPRPRDFVQFVTVTPVEEPMPAKVRVMTVHKSKGLEFDVVVLPELHKAMARGSPLQPDVYREHPTGPVLAVHRSSNEMTRQLSHKLAKAPAQDLSIAHDQVIASRLRDDLSAFYVAMTRPRHALHMILPPLKFKANGEPQAAGYSDLSPAAILRSLLVEPADQQENKPLLFEAGDPQWDQEALPLPSFVQFDPADSPPGCLHVKLPASPEPGRSWRIIAPSSLEAGARVQVEDIFRLGNQQGRQVGSLVHAMFQQVAWLDDSAAPLDMQAIASQARRLVPEASSQQLADVIQSFERMLQAPAVRQALARPGLTDASGKVELWRERPFAVRLEASLLRGVLDRVVIQRDAAGVPLSAWLLDFKTDRLGGDGVHGVVSLYRPQIKAYQRALAVMLGLPVGKISASLLLTGPGLLTPVD